jgi:hypothetical protein
MKKIFSILVTILVVSSSLIHARPSKLKLGFVEITNYETRNHEIHTKFPLSLIPHIGKYLTIDGLSVTFTSNKKAACKFNVEHVVKTLMGTVYYRITYHNKVLIWDEAQKNFVLISKDDRINPLRKQIQWQTFLKWFHCMNSMTSLQNESIQVTSE